MPLRDALLLSPVSRRFGKTEDNGHLLALLLRTGSPAKRIQFP